MTPSRRQFVQASLTLAGSAAIVGCTQGPAPDAGSQESIAPPGPAVDIGTGDAYSAEGVFTQYRDQGFFLIRQAGNLRALSSICTHRGCKVTAQTEGGFLCKCHGARYDAAGQVVSGPAPRNLPFLTITDSPQGHLIVDPAKPATP